MSIPRTLQDRLRQGHVVPFVGAGVSMSVLDRVSHQPIFPSWHQLLSGAADRLEEEAKTSQADVIRSLLKVPQPDLQYAAKQARAALGPVWYEFLKEKLDIEFDRVYEGSLDLARSIWRVGSNLIITTNYDNVLKWACPQPHDLQSWDIDATAEQAALLRQKLQRPVIWHLHGRISNAAQLILSPDGYQLLYPETNGDQSKVKFEAALETLRNQLASKTFLFVGFSLDDEYFGLQLKRVHEIYKGAAGPHYAVVREAHAERVRELDIEPITYSGFGEPLLARMAEFEAAVDTNGVSTKTKPSIIPDYSPHLPVFYVPFKQKGNEIVGQQDVLEQVRKQLTEGKPTAIGQTAAFRGLGGLGKTQLAIEYAYRFRDEYPNGVIWLNADQDIDAQLIEIAEKARWIAPESEHKYKIQIAQQRIRSHSDCLIVFDNLEDRRAIDPYLPEPEANPHILVTSRTDHADFFPVPLEVLDEKFSRELLLNEARRGPENEDEEKAVRDIVALLGGLPLALELAGAYLGHRRAMSFQQYHELLAKDLKSALPKSVSSFTKHEADLYATLRLSEDLLQEEEHLRDVLDLLTWSGSAPMGIDLLSRLLDVPNDGTLARALALGAELRLLQRSKERDSYSLHRLVGEVRRAEIPLEQRLEWVNTICGRLGNWFEEKKGEFSQLTTFESEIDHLKTWQENAARFAPSHSSKLMWLQAYPAYHRGRYVEARDYIIEARRILDRVSAVNAELKANLINDLANTNLILGDYSSVWSNHMEVLHIRQELFGERHSDIATSLNNVGGVYYNQGDLQSALEYFQLALAMFRELFGERHSDIAGSLNNVGSVYFDQGDLQSALEYFQLALTMRRELFAGRHPDTANSLNSIGSVYYEQGDLRRGAEYLQLSLTMRRELFGERHPDIAYSLNNVGNLYKRQGDLEGAEKYFELALSMRRELFGERHPDIANSLRKLGTLYGTKGDLKRALAHSHQALAMYRQLYGDRHAPTFETAVQVAVNLIRLNCRREAYDLVKHFVLLAQGPAREQLKDLEAQLLSKPIRPGFRQPPKSGKRKNKKKRK
jgi:tetratricopeptide (TPR) repeat protein